MSNDKGISMINSGLMSSNTDKWATPQWLFDTLDAHYQFGLDVCALAENAKCKKYFTPDQNGLKQKWEGMCWMNPPYGREIGKWVKKANDSSLEGAIVVALLPARTDTAWFWDYVYYTAKIEFIRGRLKFGDGKGGAPFPSMIAVWDNTWDIPTIGYKEWDRRDQLFRCSCHDIRGRYARS
jgi:phage N-6-adenine-methyltransferase